MIKRRDFLLGVCCSASVTLGTNKAKSQSDDNQRAYTCKTVSTSNPDELVVVQYRDSGEKLEIEKKINELKITPFGTSYLKDRWLPQHGLTPSGKITLGVFFLEGSDRQKKMVREAAEEWLKLGLDARFDLDFDVPQERSQIRIGFDSSDGNWSYVGRNCLSIGLSSRTMNIADLIPHVCMHEWGHTFCLQHEHQFPSGIKYNDQVVIQDAKRLWGWSEQQTKRNILSKLGSDAVCVGDAQFNPDSIMLYPVLPGWTTNGFSSGNILKISNRDISCLRGRYNF